MDMLFDLVYPVGETVACPVEAKRDRLIDLAQSADLVYTHKLHPKPVPLRLE